MAQHAALGAPILDTVTQPVPECKCSSSGRNLVVCIDGTSNQFSKNNTNVVELYDRLIKDGEQLTFYTSGIGTYARPSWFSLNYLKQAVAHTVDLAIALRFERIVLDAYRWLTENYASGDRIFLFGFSRGAYQVRVLAAMIDSVGLLHKGNEGQIPFAYRLYAESTERSKHDGKIDEARPKARTASQQPEKSEPTTQEVLDRFKQAFSHSHARIHFLGAWDTVSSVGVVYNKTLPGTTDGMSKTCFFRHALALHERRVKFLPEYVNGGLGPVVVNGFGIPNSTSDPRTLPTPVVGGAPQTSVIGQTLPPTEDARPHIKEVWFAGCHSDIGGGAVTNWDMQRFGPALRWMSFEATIAGLKLNSDPPLWQEETTVTESMRWYWAILECLPVKHLTYRAKDKMTRRPHGGAPRLIQPGQMIHASAFTPLTGIAVTTHGLAHPNALRTSRLKNGLTPAKFANAMDPPLPWDENLMRRLKLVEDDPYSAARRVLEKITWPTELSNLSHDDIQTLKNTLLTRSGRHAITYVESDFDRKELEVRKRAEEEKTPPSPEPHQPVRPSPLAILARLLTIALNDAPCEPRSNDVANDLIDCAVQILETLDTCYRTLQRPMTFSRLPAKGMHEFLRRLGSPDKVTIFRNLLSARPCAPPLRVFGKHTTPNIVALLPMPENRIICLSRGVVLAGETWDLGTQSLVSHVHYAIRQDGDDKHTVTCAAIHGDARSIITGTRQGLFQAWSIDDGKLVDSGRTRLTGTNAQRQTQWLPNARLTCIALSQNGRELASGWENGAVVLYDAATFEKKGEFTGHSSRIRSVSYAPQGWDLAVTASNDRSLRICDVSSNDWECLRELTGHHTDHVYHAVISPDGMLVASGSKDRTVIVWDVVSGKPICDPFVGHEAGVSCVAFAADGHSVASGSEDKTVRLWDAHTGSQLGVYSDHTVAVTSIISVAGNRFVSIDDAGNLLQWDEWSEPALETPEQVDEE